MKKLKTTLIASIVIFSLHSCGGGTSKQPANAEGFTAIEKELKDKFGDNAFYTDIHISQDDRLGNMVTLTVTEDPESMKMGQWNLVQDSWTQTSEISLEVPEGSKAADFMYQLDDTINLPKFGELVEKSIARLAEEKNIENPKLFSGAINYPKNGDISDMEYSISLKPESGGTTFRFSYKLNGELIKMDY